MKETIVFITALLFSGALFSETIKCGKENGPEDTFIVTISDQKFSISQGESNIVLTQDQFSKIEGSDYINTNGKPKLKKSTLLFLASNQVAKVVGEGEEWESKVSFSFSYNIQKRSGIITYISSNIQGNEEKVSEAQANLAIRNKVLNCKLTY